MRTITIDFETFYDDECSVRTLGNWAYTHHERFDPYLMAVHDGSESWVGHPNDFNFSSLEGARLVAHNAGFERAVVQTFVEKGKAPANLGPYFCTADMSAFMCSERALDAAMRVLKGLVVSKAARSAMKGKGWYDIPADKKKVMQEYCLGDVMNTHGLYTEYADKWPQFEQDLSALTRQQCAHGVRINQEVLQRYKRDVQEALFIVVKTMPWTAEGGKPTSPKEIAEECRKNGIPGPPVKTHDEEGFDQWIEIYGNKLNSDGSPKFPWIYGVGDWRRLNKILTTLETIENRLRPDGTIDFSLLYFGGHTGRWSGGGSGFNLQNQRRDPLVILFRANGGVRLYECALDCITEPGAFSVIDMRALLIPREGKKFIICDLSQIEPRVLAHLIGNRPLLDAMASGQSPYEAHARTTMGWTGGDLKKENPGLYKLAKARVLGLGYGCGDDKFVTVAWNLAQLRITPEESSQCVQDFRMSNPLTTGLWKALDLAFRNSCGGDFKMGLPSGRDMVYRKVHREARHRYNKKSEQIEKRDVYIANIGLDKFEFYGGALTENLVQAVARDVFGVHLLDLQRQAGDVVFHVHDEAILECDPEIPVKEVERIMSRTPEWLDGCPISAEGQEAFKYLK